MCESSILYTRKTIYISVYFADAWNWVMSWLDTIPHQAMVTLVQKHFFPKWLQVLCSWLSAMPNYNEVTKWYTGWKSMFPEALASDAVIKGKQMIDISVVRSHLSLAAARSEFPQKSSIYVYKQRCIVHVNET